MSERTLKRILVVLAGLAVVYAAVLLLGRGSGSAATNGELASVLEHWTSDTATAFVISSPGASRLELVAAGDGWTVNGMPADSAAVDRLQTAIRNARVSGVVSTNAQNHARLGVTADSAVQLEIRGRDTTTLLIGKNSSRGIASYVRLPEQDETAEVSGDMRGAAARPLGDWRDKVMVRVDTARIVRIAIQRDTSYSLHRIGNGWRVAALNATADSASPAADSLAVSNVLAELLRFEATAFAPDTATFSGSDNRRVVALGTNGDTLAALEFAGREYIWRARRIGNTTLYDAPSYRIDRIAPKRGEIGGG
jgi:hypothetical protein